MWVEHLSLFVEIQVYQKFSKPENTIIKILKTKKSVYEKIIMKHI